MTDTDMQEVWRTVPGYAPYQASTLGRIRRNGRVLVMTLDRKGYPRVTTSIAGTRHLKMVHRLVAEAFIGPMPNNKTETNHKNGLKTDNRPENLEYVTCSENKHHASRLGLAAKGVGHGLHKLTADDVRGIRRLASKFSQRALGKLFDVSEKTIWDIIHDKTWRHVA